VGSGLFDRRGSRRQLPLARHNNVHNTQATTTTTTITTTTTAPLKPVPPPKPIIPQQNIAETVIEKKPLDQLITKPLPTPGARRILPKPPENN